MNFDKNSSTSLHYGKIDTKLIIIIFIFYNLNFQDRGNQKSTCFI